MRLEVGSQQSADPVQTEQPARAKAPSLRYGLVIVVLLAAIGALVAWVVANYRPPATPYENRAVFIFPLLILLVDLAAQWLALRSLGHEQREASESEETAQPLPLALPQVALPLYLACGVLLGVQTAVLAALAIQTILQTRAFLSHRLHAREAVYQVLMTGLVVLAGGLCYQGLLSLAPASPRSIPFSLRLVTAAAGAAVMLALCPFLVSPFDHLNGRKFLLHHWLGYFKTAEARFQVLLLSIGPLLPLVAKIDDIEAEFAWVLFLTPLFAIYYLALVSLRFQLQTDELRASLRALRLARRRQAQLQDYAALVTRAQEDERRRLARELHDDTAQALIALSRGLEALADARTPTRPQTDERWVEDLRELADRSLESVRRACRDLRPSVLDDLGLAAALDWLAEGMTQRGLPCHLRVTGQQCNIPNEAELVFFRIAQEALTNAWRHARASQAEVVLEHLPGLLRLSVRDTGRGFEMAQLEQRDTGSGLGLLGMRERAALVGAALSITSAPGQGTRVEVQLSAPASA